MSANSHNELLIELLVEELPPKALAKLDQAFSKVLVDELKKQDLLIANAHHESFATPRRLGVLVHGVLSEAPSKEVEQKLMPKSVGLTPEGEPSAALTKKLNALGLGHLSVSDLLVIGDGKAEQLWVKSIQNGVSLVEGAQKALNEAISKLPIPKVMSYQLHQGCELPGWSSVNFVRPVHGLVALYGQDVLALEALGLKATRNTKGHRFEAKAAVLELTDAQSYEKTLLETGAVIASYGKRKENIRSQLLASAAKLGSGLTVIEDEALLDEVCALVERPNVLTCQFEEAFLQVPQECLILTMKANQKYFPLMDAQGKLANHFLVVSNISPADPIAVISGNERVVRPRLSDAQFFFEQDKKVSLESRVPGLEKVVYHQKLGTQGERSARVLGIAKTLSKELLNLGALSAAQVKSVEDASRLAKVDLLTDMVGEFPELQGIMGQYYALNDGYPKDVAMAIEDHYRPRFAGDALPRDAVGVVLALADKLETLVGLFAIGQQPTADKDPYALRRHALGVIRIIREKGLNLSLTRMLTQTTEAFVGHEPQGGWSAVLESLKAFFFDRLAGALKESGYAAKEIEAVLSLKPDLLTDIDLRLQAVRAFALLAEAPALAAANKRISNILKKSQDALVPLNTALLSEGAERELFDAMAKTLPEAKALFSQKKYTESLASLAPLKTSVDHFFDGVMVNAPELEVRQNRLALLTQLHEAMNGVADLSVLA
jgi:glycyl-tRNA synthetase beta chain